MSAGLPIGYLVKRLQAAFRARMDDALASHGLTTASYAALHHLATGGTMSAVALARASWVTPQTMTRVVGGLKERGFVAAEAGPGRAILLHITHQGAGAYAEAERDVMGIEATMVSALRTAEVDQLRRLLTTCHASLTAE